MILVEINTKLIIFFSYRREKEWIVSVSKEKENVNVSAIIKIDWSVKGVKNNIDR